MHEHKILMACLGALTLLLCTCISKILNKLIYEQWLCTEEPASDEQDQPVLYAVADRGTGVSELQSHVTRIVQLWVDEHDVPEEPEEHEDSCTRRS